MGAQTGLLAALATLLCTKAYGAESCSGFRHLENGRTFFRYGGLLVIFHCHPGYKLHGYQMNSCVSGQWSREPPVCVGSGCLSPGPLLHGESSVNEDGSWAVFSCNSGFRLHGPSMIYCKGHNWNSTKPVCKEYDMMSSVSHTVIQKPNTQQDLQAPLTVKNQQQSHYDTFANTPSKQAHLKLGLLSRTPSQTSNTEGVKLTHHKVHLEQHVQNPNAKVLLKDGIQNLHHEPQFQKRTEAPVTKSVREEERSGRWTSMGPDRRSGGKSSVAKEEDDRLTPASQMPLTHVAQFTTESHLLFTTLLSEGASTSSSSLFSRTQIPASTVITNTAIKHTPAAETVTFQPTQEPPSPLPVPGGEKMLKLGDEGGLPIPNTSQGHVTHPEIVTGSSAPANESPRAATVSQNPLLSESPRQGGSVQGQQPGSEGEEELAATIVMDQSTTEPPDIRIKHQPWQKQAFASPHTSSPSAYSNSASFVSAPPSASSPFLTPSAASSSSPIPLPSLSASAASTHSSAQSNAKAPMSHVTAASHVLTPTEGRPGWTENYNFKNNVTIKLPTLSLILSRRPVCPYPPVPAHGTFYFRNVENPGPREYRHYIQYACYPGYTLAHGDVHSFCQQGGKWSGVTPVCLELTPCSVNNGGCSQLCSNSHNHSQSYNQTQCHCRPGFTLLDDRRTCRDLDECVEVQHQCQQRCINTFGSFKCDCNDGYQLAHDQTSCTDVDECLLPVAVTGCVFGCVNSPGSFHCQCPAGYSLQTADGHCQDIDECAVNQGLGPCVEQCHNLPGSYRCSCTFGRTLAGDGRSCIAQCPPGFRRQSAPTPQNSTTQAPREECVDIDECQEETPQHNRCEWQCVNLPGSHRCICPKGYTLETDGQHCKDINECIRKNGGCSHLCVNHKGGYKCACPSSHRLSPYSWKKCVPRKH